MNMYILHAINILTNHKFIELFTCEQLLESYLENHIQIKKLEITIHEINPI